MPEELFVVGAIDTGAEFALLEAAETLGCAAAIDCDAVGVSATADGSLLVVAKMDPPRIKAPASTKVAIGNFLSTFLIPAYESPASVSSNHSGFFGVIVDLFRWLKDKPAFLERTEKEAMKDCQL
jgi:hypothetical protein